MSNAIDLIRRLEQNVSRALVGKPEVIRLAVVGLLAIRGLIRWLGRAGFGTFFVYRAALAGYILYRWLERR